MPNRTLSFVYYTIITMNPKIYLAPMSGVTALAFRLISRRLGAEHCFFEMLDSKAVAYRGSRQRTPNLKYKKSYVQL